MQDKKPPSSVVLLAMARAFQVSGRKSGDKAREQYGKKLGEALLKGCRQGGGLKNRMSPKIFPLRTT